MLPHFPASCSQCQLISLVVEGWKLVFVLVPCYVGPSRDDCMLNEGVRMHPS